jgi:arylsulfatase A-like enzyme
MPTVAEMAKVDAPTDIDGISFLPTLLNRDGQKQHDYLYWEFHEKKGRVAIRKGNWKGVRYNVSIDAHSPLELYDLSADPQEQYNIAMQHPDVVAELDLLMKNARTESLVKRYNFPSRR